jgi:hypothetical protein
MTPARQAKASAKTARAEAATAKEAAALLTVHSDLAAAFRRDSVG